MVPRVEVLVYAGATTSFIADERYRSQAKACLSFVPVRHHALDDVELVCTPPQQGSVLKVITPSTTKTDASDVVKDSQPSKGSFSGTGKHRTGPRLSSGEVCLAALETTSVDTLGPDLQQVMQLSARHFAEHEKSHITACTESRADPCLMPKAPSDISRLLEMSDFVATGVSTRVPQELAVTAEQFRNSETSDVRKSPMTALEALKFREAQALKLRLSRQSGLQFARTDARPDSAISGKQVARTVPGQTVFDSKIPATPVVARAVSGIKTVDVLTNTKCLQPSAIIDDSPDPIRPTCIDRYITVPTDDQHGVPVSPSTPTRTTNPSDRGNTPNIDPDMSSAQTNSALKDRKRTHAMTFDKESSEQLPVAHNPCRISPVKAAHCRPRFTQEHPGGAQSQILFAISKPADITFISSSARTRQARNLVSHVLENGATRLGYSDRSLAQILGSEQPRHATDLSLNEEVPDYTEVDAYITNHLTGENDAGAKGTSDSMDVVNSAYVAQGAGCSQDVHSERMVLSEIINSKHIKSQLDESRSQGTSWKTRATCTPQSLYIPPDKDTSQKAGGYPMYSIPNTVVNSSAPLMPKYLAETKTIPKVRASRRELRPLERGYWLVDLARLKFSVDEADALWSGLSAIMRGRELYWLTLQAVQVSIRVYCYGLCTMEVWVVIYALSRKTKRGLTWHDATGAPIIFQ